MSLYQKHFAIVLRYDFNKAMTYYHFYVTNYAELLRVGAIDLHFTVEGLTVAPVGTYQDIKVRMNEGDRQRTIAATKMNETSRYVIVY